MEVTLLNPGRERKKACTGHARVGGVNGKAVQLLPKEMPVGGGR